MNQLSDKDLELAKKHGIHDELKYYCHMFSSQELAAFLAERDKGNETAVLYAVPNYVELCKYHNGSTLCTLEPTYLHTTPLYIGRRDSEQQPNVGAVEPDYYMNPTTEEWYQHPADESLLDEMDALKVGDEYELDVSWSGKRTFKVTELNTDGSVEDVEFVSGTKLFTHPRPDNSCPITRERLVEYFKWSENGLNPPEYLADKLLAELNPAQEQDKLEETKL